MKSMKKTINSSRNKKKWKDACDQLIKKLEIENKNTTSEQKKMQVLELQIAAFDDEHRFHSDITTIFQGEDLYSPAQYLISTLKPKGTNELSRFYKTMQKAHLMRLENNLDRGEEALQSNGKKKEFASEDEQSKEKHGLSKKRMKKINMAFSEQGTKLKEAQFLILKHEGSIKQLNEKTKEKVKIDC